MNVTMYFLTTNFIIRKVLQNLKRYIHPLNTNVLKHTRENDMFQWKLKFASLHIRDNGSYNQNTKRYHKCLL